MKIMLRLFLFLLFAALLISAGVFWWGHHVFTAPNTQEKPLTLLVPQGASAKRIAQTLEAKGALPDARVFYWGAKLTGQAHALKAGEYTLDAHLSPQDILTRLTLGQTKSRMVTLPEGWTIAQMLARLNDTDGLVAEEGALEKNVKHPLTEGYLYPDTYAYTYGTPVWKIVNTQRARAEEEITKAWENRDPALPLTTPKQLVTLASIIERETNLQKEMPLVSGVYVNRINKGMLLQSDPTVIYGLIKENTWDGNLKRSHLKDETNPYNTYVHKGLPPHPIANPSSAALQAAAHPAAHNFLFFVADGTGGHAFSKTYAEHKRNVANYLQKYRAARRAEQTKEEQLADKVKEALSPTKRPGVIEDVPEEECNCGTADNEETTP